MPNYKKGHLNTKLTSKGRRSKKGSGFDKFLSSGGLGLAGLLISSVMKDGKRKS